MNWEKDTVHVTGVSMIQRLSRPLYDNEYYHHTQPELVFFLIHESYFCAAIWGRALERGVEHKNCRLFCKFDWLLIFCMVFWSRFKI
ncbi:MAG TPA: hypothetical protein DEF45_03765 [Rhodopirellula sp.]|nr:hypothetical protein [Rhodopirellula sp.]